jgi:hypothetical protein
MFILVKKNYVKHITHQISVRGTDTRISITYT